MSAQRDCARAGGQFAADYDQDIKHDSVTEFTGYSHLDGSVQVIGLFKKVSRWNRWKPATKAW